VKRSPAKSTPTGSSLASPEVLAAVVKKAKAKGARTWNVVDPLEKLGFADQASVLAALFADGSLGPKQQVAVDAAATALKLMRINRDSARPTGLVAAAVKLLSTLKNAPLDAPGMFPGYSHSLDALVSWAYALDPAPLDALADRLEGPARHGLASVRFRAGREIDPALHPTLLQGFARTDGGYTSSWETLIVGPDGLEVGDDDEIEELALRLGDRSAFHAALAEAAGTQRPLRAWLVARLDPARLCSVVGALDEAVLKRLDAETLEAVLDHPGSAEDFSEALAAVPDTAKLGKTLLAIVAGKKRVEAGLPMPRPWPLFRSYEGFGDEVGRRLLVRALLQIHRAFPAERSHGYVGTALPARFPDVMVALAAHPDEALAATVLEAFASNAHPEARGLLLARLADPGKPARGRKTKAPVAPLPDDRQLRLDYLLARCELAAPQDRDPAWLDALDLREDVHIRDIWDTVWCESRILLSFPLERRAAVVLAALRGDAPKGHAIQLLRVLDEASAAEALTAAVTSETPPPPNWLDWLLREGSLPGVERAWTRSSLLARAGDATAARCREIFGG
jgi:hypothetical protein